MNGGSQTPPSERERRRAANAPHAESNSNRPAAAAIDPAVPGNVRESERLFRSLFQNVQAGIVVSDRQGVWIDVNPALCELLGLRRDELVGRAGPERVPAEAGERRAQARAELNRTGHWRGELPLLCADGRQVMLDWQVTELSESGLRLAIATDITDRLRCEADMREMNESLLVSSVRQHELTERAEHAEHAAKVSERSTREARDYAQAILRVSPVPLLVLDSDLRILTVNEAFYRKFKVAPAATEGGLVYELGNGQWSIPKLRERLEDILSHGSSFEHLEVTHDFECIGRRTILLNARRMTVDGGGPQRIVLVLEDITERKQAEELIQEHGRALELIAKGAPLARCLEELCLGIERIDGSVRACVLLTNDERTYFTRIIAPRFPNFAEAMESVPIGDGSVGTCAQVVVSGEPVVCADIEHDAGWQDEWKALCLGYGIRAGYSAPVVEFEALPLASVFLCFDRPKTPTDWDRRVAGMATGVVGIALQRHWSEIERRADLADAQLLQRLSAEIVHQDAVEVLYEKITDAAVAVTHADFASLQMLYPERGSGGELRLLAFRGFNPQAATYWEWVRADSDSTCGEALRTGKRSLVPDVEQCDFITGTEDLATYRRTGIRAVQSTPLFSRTGSLVGMISTHWHKPHKPSARDLRLLDIIARQGADLIERKQAAEALRDADRRKDEFLAILAHELRNPLAPIRTGLELMKVAGEDPAVMEEVRGTMERQVRQLVRLIDDLMDVSRITRGKLNLQRRRLALAEVVQGAVEATQPFIDAAGHNLSVTLPAQPISIDGDPHRLTQVLSNLLNNAAKYSPQPGAIRLSARQDGNEAVISVIDEGLGIAPEKLSEIFEMFSQIDRSPHAGNVGLGIGLTLAKSLVEMHGGTVEVRSGGANLGSEFMLRLPAATDRVTAPAEPPTPSSPGFAVSKHRVLVVDDNEDAARTLSLACRVLGNDVRVVHDGMEAVAAAAEFRPEVVLMDIGLPRMNGYEAAQHIRAHAWGAEMLLVAVTGWGQDEDRRRTREAGFDRHLVKPVESAALQAVFAELSEKG